ncbi:MULTISPECIES: helix-turn-helix domain-containing protein [Mycobacteriaceae]|nr:MULTISPECIES: helix-turn-helix domain-containing protein [Mycobacteriaceae]
MADPNTYPPPGRDKAQRLPDKGITATDIAKILGLSRATVYRYLAPTV